jgi:hypothetical protein
MRNRYAQIALTYPRRWSMRIWATGALAIIAWLGLSRHANAAEQFAMLMLGGTMCVFAAALVTSQLKEQIADARSSLTPNYRAPHLIVAGAALLATTFVLPLWLAVRFTQITGDYGWPPVHVWPPGYLAIVLLASAAMAWMGYLQSPVFIFCVMAAGVVFILPFNRPLNWETVSGRWPAATWVMLTISVAAFVALWWRMARLHEEMAEFHRLDTFSPNLKVSMTGDRFYRRSAAAEVGRFNELLRGASRIDRVRNVFGAPLARRAAHWRLAIGFARANPIFGALFGMMLLALAYFGGDRHDKSERGLLIGVPILMGLVVPILIAASTWPRRWYTLAQDSLRPATRREFFLEQGLAMGWELVNLWFWITAGSLLPTLIYHPDWLRSPTTLGLLTLSFAEQLVLLGVFVWIVRYRTAFLFTWITSLLAAGAAGYLFVHEIGQPDDRLHAPSPLVVIAVAIVALPILLDAYRRWLRTDLD